MLQRLFLWAIRTYVGGPARSWVFTSAAMLLARLVRSSSGRRETLDLSSIKPGEMLIVEHLPISHKAQIREGKREKRRQRRDRRRLRRN